MNGAESKSRRGRPLMAQGDRKGSMFSVRLTTKERAEVEAAARRDRAGASEWARRTMLAAARSSCGRS